MNATKSEKVIIGGHRFPFDRENSRYNILVINPLGLSLDQKETLERNIDNTEPIECKLLGTDKKFTNCFLRQYRSNVYLEYKDEV